MFDGTGHCVQGKFKSCLRPQLVFDKQAQRIEIDKSNLAVVFPANDFLVYLFYKLLMSLHWRSQDEAEDLNQRLYNCRFNFNKRGKFIKKDTMSLSSEEIAKHYSDVVSFLKEIIPEIQPIRDLCKGERNRELMSRYIKDTENIIAGLELLLDDSHKKIDINEFLKKMHALVFSQYYKDRSAYNCKVDFRLSTDNMIIFNQQNRIAYVFFYLLYPFLHKIGKEALVIETYMEYSKEGKPFISIKFYGSEADVNLEGIRCIDKVKRYPAGTFNINGATFSIEAHEDIKYRTIEFGYLPASKLINELGGSIDLIREDEKIRGFKVLLPLSEHAKTVPGIIDEQDAIGASL